MLVRVRQKRAKRRFFKLLVLILLIFFLYSIINHLVQTNKQSANKEIASFSVAKISSRPKISPTPFQISTGLQQTISDALKGSTGTYGIVVKNLKTGESYFAHQTHTFKSGSLYKLWVMAVVFENIKQGTLKDTDVLSETVPALNEKFEIDPTLAEKTEGTITFSVNDALNQMITISDNYAALLLAEKVGLANIAKFLKDYEFNQSKIGINGKDPTTTPNDIALFFEKLYNGEIINKDYSDKMLTLLKQQKLNSKIPQYLPDSITVAHKTGELDEDSHDAGIVYTPDGDYVIVVLSESDSIDLANERIADISQNVYNYFTNSTPQPTEN